MVVVSFDDLRMCNEQQKQSASTLQDYMKNCLSSLVGHIRQNCNLPSRVADNLEPQEISLSFNRKSVHTDERVGLDAFKCIVN